jgi:hypothetical protein
MRYDGDRHIDGSDRAIKKLVKEHNKAIRQANKTAEKADKRKTDSFGTSRLRMPLFRNGQPCPNDIRQVGIGNCYLLAALLAMTERHPDYIKDMITQKADGSVVVRLWDVEKNVEGIYTPNPVYYHLDYTSANAWIPNWHKAGWVYLIEKAYYLHRLRHNKKADGRWRYRDVLSSGRASNAFRYLTGATSNTSSITKLPHALDRLLLSEDTCEMYMRCDELCNTEEAVTATRRSLIKNLYFEEGSETLAAWQAYLGAHLTDRLKTTFPANSYPTLVELLSSVKAKDDKKAKRHIKEIWGERLTQKERAAILEGLKKASAQPHPEAQALSDELRQTLHQALQAGNILCTGTIHDKQALKDTGVVKGHAYHLLNIYKRGNRWVVLLENPWGRSVPKTRFYQGSITEAAIAMPDHTEHARGGEFELSFELFHRYFKNYSSTDVATYQTALDTAVEISAEVKNNLLAAQQQYLDILYNGHANTQAEDAATTEKMIMAEAHSRAQAMEIIQMLRDNPHRTDADDILLDILERKHNRDTQPEADRDSGISVDAAIAHSRAQAMETIQMLRDNPHRTDADDILLDILESKHNHDTQPEADRDSGISVDAAMLTNEQEIHKHIDATTERLNAQHATTNRLRWQRQHARALANGLSSSEQHNNTDINVDNDTGIRSTLLIDLKRELLLYTKNSHSKQDIKDKSLKNRMHYRLFYHGEDRQVSQKHKRRANTLLAYIDAWHRAESSSDKQTLEAMMLTLRDHHEESRTLTSCFHGNRLGKMMEKLNQLSLSKDYKHVPLSQLSLTGARLLNKSLRYYKLNPEIRKNMFFSDLNFQPDETRTIIDELSQHLSMS